MGTRVLHARELPKTRPGRFPLGRLQASARARLGAEVAWDPWGGDGPHCLISGETGSGKSRLLEHWSLQALSWGWRVTILDPKGGADYVAAERNGAQVIFNARWITDELGKVVAEIDARNAYLRETPVLSPSGKDDRAPSWADLPPSLATQTPWLVILDEAASLVAFDRQLVSGNGKANGTGGARAAESLRHAVQLGRSAGVHITLSIQRPDAEFIGGFAKHNLAERIMLGRPRTQASDSMMFELAGDDPETREVRSTDRGVGVALVQGCGLLGLSRVLVHLLDRDRFLPDAFEPEPHHGEGSVRGAETAPLPAPLGSPSPDAADGPWFTVLGEPPAASTGGETPLRSKGEVPLGRASKPPLGRSPRPRFARLRASLRGPAARLRLRASATRLLRSPPTDAPRTRSPALRRAALGRDDYACTACGATHRKLEVDHDPPLSFGGADALEGVRTLCVRCHRAKTRAEATVRALRRRRGGRPGHAGHRLTLGWRSLHVGRLLLTALFLSAFLAGLALADERWGVLGIAGLGAWVGLQGKGRARPRVSALLVCALLAAGAWAPTGLRWL